VSDDGTADRCSFLGDGRRRVWRTLRGLLSLGTGGRALPRHRFLERRPLRGRPGRPRRPDLFRGFAWTNNPTHQFGEAVMMFILAGVLDVPALFCCVVMIWVIVRSLRRPVETPS
jgi:hypothetical protein